MLYLPQKNCSNGLNIFCEISFLLNVSSNEHFTEKNCSNGLNIFLKILVLLNVSPNEHFRQKNCSFEPIWNLWQNDEFNFCSNEHFFVHLF